MGHQYSSLSIEERTQLGLLLERGLSQQQMAVQLGRSAAAINRELARHRHPVRGVRIQPPHIDIS
jgi:IS30 family transposase